MTFWWSDPISFLIAWLRGLLQGWGLAPDGTTFILFVIGAGGLATGAMVFCIFLIWLERKIAGRFQDRLGPNRVGPWGLVQPIADMLKIFTKEYITPRGVDRIPYNLAPVLKVASVLLMWAVIPFAVTMMGVDLSVGTLYIIAVGALGELAIIMAGWSSNNKYALVGAFRVVAQLISYEVPMVVALLIPVLLTGSLSMNALVKAQQPWFLVTAPVAAFIFFIASVAEMGRAPFDLIEAESEIVAGFNIEYSGLKFGMFFVGEFLHAFTSALIYATLFLGGWNGPGSEQYPILGFFYLLVKTGLVYFLTLSLRFSLPRFRIDQMMDFNWKFLTPLSLAALVSTALVAKLFQHSPAWVSVIALLAVNVLLVLVTIGILNSRQKRQPALATVVSERVLENRARTPWMKPAAQAQAAAAAHEAPEAHIA
jgi:NADH-quinone oxidoreductase subunit H